MKSHCHKQSCPDFPPSEQQDLILEALRLYIHIFWSSGESRDWNALIQDCLHMSRSFKAILPDSAQALEKEVNRLSMALDPEELSRTMESSFIRLFVSSTGGIAAPLYHSCYHEPDGLLMREPAREMDKLLDMAGLELETCSREPGDHLCIELEYLFFLLSSLRRSTDQDLHRLTREFAQDFMLPWICRWSRAISGDDESKVFYQLGVMLTEIIELAGRCTEKEAQHS